MVGILHLSDSQREVFHCFSLRNYFLSRFLIDKGSGKGCSLLVHICQEYLCFKVSQKDIKFIQSLDLHFLRDYFPP